MQDPKASEALEQVRAQISVTDPDKPVRLREEALKSHWQDASFMLMAKLTEALALNRASDAKAYAIAAGVSTDKLLLLMGRPTQISANVHEIRHKIPDIVDKLQRVAGRVIEVKKIEKKDNDA